MAVDPFSATLGGISLLGGIGSSIFGSGDQSKRAEEQQKNLEEAIKRIYDVESPDPSKMQISPEMLSQMGELSPEMESYLFGLPLPTASLLAAEDQRYLDPQLDALAQLSNIAGAQGMDAQGMAAMEEARMGNAAAARGAREANLTNAAQRGGAGSGLEFVSNQMADQNAANQNNLYGLNQAALANQRRLDALNQMSNLAGTMSERDLGLELHRADSQDAMNKLTSEFLRDAQQRNVDRANTAQAQNLSEKQRVADQNVAFRNYGQEYNAKLPQQNFDNNMKKASTAAGVTTGTSESQAIQSQAAGNMWGGIGQGLTGTAGALFSNMGKTPTDDTNKLLREQNELLKKKQGGY